MKATTTVNLWGAYLWPIHETPADPIQWHGIDLSDVLDGPLPGLCAYYGHRARHAVSADHQRAFPSGGTGRTKGERPIRAIATIELDVALTNPVPDSTNSIDRWKHAGTPVIDLREDRYPHDLLPMLEARFAAKRRSGVCAALSASPVRARELLIDLPHLEAVVMPLDCNDDTHRIQLVASFDADHARGSLPKRKHQSISDPACWQSDNIYRHAKMMILGGRARSQRGVTRR